MSRRVKLPGADELFRPTTPVDDGPRAEAAVEAPPAKHTRAGSRRGSSGRIRHDEKITVYVTADELLALEHTRLSLRAEHGVAVDRGRIVREAIHLALEGVEHEGADSALLRRLRES